jgi:hypothetical protein
LCCAARYTGPISNKSGELFRQRPSGQWPLPNLLELNSIYLQGSSLRAVLF